MDTVSEETRNRKEHVNNNTSIADAARIYYLRGWQPLPVRNGKNPGYKDWESFTCSPDTVERHFTPRVNIGLLNGEPSQGLVDVDLDTTAAVAVAGAFLPPTAMIGGHERRRASHAFYQLIDADGNLSLDGKTHQFKYTIEKVEMMVVELRATGSQTVVAPSVHPEGGQYCWEECGAPGRVTYAVLLLAIRKLAIAATLAEHWPNPGRHNTGLAVAGMLYSCGVAEEDARALVEAAARADGHQGVTDRVRTVTDTYRTAARGKPIRGIPSLAETFPDPVVKKLLDWCRAIATRPPHTGTYGETGTADAWTEEEEQQQHTAWPEPGALPEGLLPVPAMVAEMIPEPFRPWLTDIAERMQCPLDFPVIGALTALAGVVGRRIGIRPKQQDDWLVTPNLWGAIIGRPGLMKTPTLTEAMRPLNRLVMDAQKEYEDALAKFPVAQMLAEARREALKKRIADDLRAHAKKDTKKKKTTEDPPEPMTEDEIAAELEACLKAAQPPVQRRYLVNDSTVEKLGELLNQNPNGLLLFRDELTGWLRMLDREGHQNDRPFYNECWNGDKAYTYDRIGRGTLHIKAACLSLLGGIQPGPLAVYLHGAMQGGADDDGLVQRLQLLVYPDDPAPWQHVDRWPDTAAKNRAYKIFQDIAELDPGTLGAHVEEGVPMPFLRFAPDAQEKFNEWWTDLEETLRTPDEHPAIESHLSKYRSLMPSLALLFHLITCVDEGTAGPVFSPATDLAAAWCDYLEAHARRVYQAVTQPAVLTVRRLAAKIAASELPSPFALRIVLKKGWSGLTTLDDVREAAEMLEDLDWLRSERSESGTQGGRPRLLYHINPTFPPKQEKKQ